MTDEQLFLRFWKKVRTRARKVGVEVTTDDLGYYVCWGEMRWLYRFDPDAARRGSDEPQVAEAMSRIRASL